MKFNYINWECGCGKTTALLNHIAVNPDLYIVAINKIELIAEHETTLKSLVGPSPIQIWQIHSKNGDGKMGVGARIVDQVQTTNESGETHCVIFITHEALLLVDWTRQEVQSDRWKLFIDEAPMPWNYTQGSFDVSHQLVQQFITPRTGNVEIQGTDKFIPVELTEMGEKLRTSRNDLMKQVMGQFLNEATGARYAFANRSFFNQSNSGDKSKKLEIFSIIDPEILGGFKEATILAANFENTFAYKIWSAFDVEFNKHPAFAAPPPRPVPLKNRIKIHYFGERDASLNYFNNPVNPLQVMSKWVDDNLAVPFYYAVNNEVNGKNRRNLITNPLAKKIQPVALGSNQLVNYQAAVWLTALKANPAEYNTIMDIFRINRDQYDRAQEHEKLYQFVLRSNLREFNSSKMVDVYVVSKRQAEILQQITGADSINWVGTELPEPIVEKDNDANPVGRPVKHLTAEQKAEAQRISKLESARRRRAKEQQQKGT